MLDPTLLRRFIAVSMFAMFGFAPSAHAADNSPSVRAARLTLVQGAVSVSAVNQAATAAQVNQPLLTGAMLSTGGDGQAEVEFEDGSVVRLTPNSALSLDNLAVDPGGIFTSNLSLLHGLAYLELRATPEYQYFLNAGGDVLSPVENTTVRVNFDEPPAIFAVLDGTAHVEGLPGPEGTPNNGGFEADLRAGESLRGDATSSSRYFLTQEIAQDTWDQWNEDQDQAAAAATSADTGVRNNYAGVQGYGWSDLDAEGSWYDVPGQGQVWQPDVAGYDSGFDPYGYGAWVWSGGGYLWASSYPWGWTPYRCGNWSYYNGFGWGWAPGAGCGGLGWGFAGGGGYPVNLSRVPPGYRPVRPPTGHGPEHPLVPVRTAVPPERPRNFTPAARGSRQIGGLTATPIAPRGFNVVSGGSSVGSSLRRDYPVDSRTHAPVLGLASTTPAVVRTTPGAPAPRRLPATANRPAGMRPAAPQQPYAGQGYAPPGGTATGAQSARPAQQIAPQRGTPAPAPTARQYAPSAPAAPTAPPAASPHSTYSAPPAQHPTYSPPPEPRYTPPPEPRYSPPSAPPEPRYSPPPPPPAPAAQPAPSAKPK